MPTIPRLVVLAALSFTGPAFSAEQARTFADGRGGHVALPAGEASFADEVVTPPARGLGRPDAALGPPTYRRIGDDSHLTLGCGGQVTLRFTDNDLVDGPGPDLWVFESGDAPEGVEVWVSLNGGDWRRAGTSAGGVSAVDIAPAARPGERYPFVRLVDLGQRCDGPWPGADLDAVAAVGRRPDAGAPSPPLDAAGPPPADAEPPPGFKEVARTTLRDAVLFDLDRAVLRPDAARRLKSVVGQAHDLAGGRILVEGHTCSLGSERHNQRLSEARAEAVRRFLVTAGAAPATAIASRGFGETRPTAPNATDAGRRQNRRVEIVFYAPDTPSGGPANP